MWKAQLIDGPTKSLPDDGNLLPLLSELNPKDMLVLPTIGNGIVNSRKKPSDSFRKKSVYNLAKINLSECETICRQ